MITSAANKKVKNSIASFAFQRTKKAGGLRSRRHKDVCGGTDRQNFGNIYRGNSF